MTPQTQFMAPGDAVAPPGGSFCVSAWGPPEAVPVFRCPRISCAGCGQSPCLPGQSRRLGELHGCAQPLLRVFRADGVPHVAHLPAGDIQHSPADVSLGEKVTGCRPRAFLEQGLRLAIDWYKKNLA